MTATAADMTFDTGTAIPAVAAGTAAGATHAVQPMTDAAARIRNVNVASPTATLPSVVYFDEVIARFMDDDTGLPPVEDDDDGDDEPQCVYAYGGIDTDEDFADLRHPVDADDIECHERPEYYIKATSSDPGDDGERLDTYYYCPRHFALNLGYLCDTMDRRTPDMEIARFLLNGELPPRHTIQDWGPIVGR
ncbi:hypothetical protein [Bifidobacterium samirii]|uniref:Uncharacterized protein n=1 Tax=Bifidobacterium samirii TaxID=2306974 RepID=A0A430FPB1_9BIFI|nr:hypothetical protein [Bifidobacterium samirii]RSX54672.1 hypothetical protein D2E24_1442 [Bifidobacterium samirii]